MGEKWKINRKEKKDVGNRKQWDGGRAEPMDSRWNKDMHLV